MGGVVIEAQKKRLFWIRLAMVDDPLLTLGRKQIGAVAFLKVGRDFFIIPPNLLFASMGL